MPLTIELAAFTVREGAEPQLLAERPEMLGAEEAAARIHQVPRPSVGFGISSRREG
jgi:hypothetical protein